MTSGQFAGWKIVLTVSALVLTSHESPGNKVGLEHKNIKKRKIHAAGKRMRTGTRIYYFFTWPNKDVIFDVRQLAHEP
jgi:hypothetical protein